MLNYSKLIRLRRKNNLRQVDLAKKLNVGVSTIGMWETGQRQPDYEMLIQIANLFDVSTDYLLDVPVRAREELPRFDEELEPAVAVKMIKDYIMSQDWSDEKKELNIKQIELMFGEYL